MPLPPAHAIARFGSFTPNLCIFRSTSRALLSFPHLCYYTERCYPYQLSVFYRAGWCDGGACSLASGGDWHIMGVP
eukprot:6677896-Pyramimonas_sp.AAC.1